MGDRELEKKLHSLLAEARISGELFRDDYRIDDFVRIATRPDLGGLERAMRFLEEETPQRRAEILRLERVTAPV